MISAAEYTNQASRIVGLDVSKGEGEIRCRWSNRENGKAEIQRLRLTHSELRQLKKDVSADISRIKSEFASAKTTIGTGFGAGLAAGLFGRKTMGKANAIQRDQLRRKQIDTVAPYERIRGNVDQLLAIIDNLKSQIELSPEYQSRPSQSVARVLDVQTSRNLPLPTPSIPPALPAPPAKRFYAYLGTEVKGPYTIDQILLLHDAGTVSPETMVCLEGTEHWTAFSEVFC